MRAKKPRSMSRFVWHVHDKDPLLLQVCKTKMCVCDVSETLVRDVKQSTSTDILKKKYEMLLRKLNFPHFTSKVCIFFQSLKYVTF